MKTYVITVSQHFPKTHPRAGAKTGFVEKIKAGAKRHTIRANYDLWEKRFKEIDAGRACLSLRIWTSKPYRSPQREIMNFTNADGIGIERLTFYKAIFYQFATNGVYTSHKIADLAANDGLTTNEFEAWFSDYNLNEPMAIIHFTDFRYTPF